LNLITVVEQATFLPTFQASIEIMAVLAFALSGVVAGMRKGLDIVGVCFVAGIAAFGGGTFRDLFLDRRPFFWVEQDYLIWLVLGVCALASFLLSVRDAELTEKWIQIPDAVGLGLFSALGAQIAIEQGYSPIIAILMGVFSSTLGGVLRDVFCNELPKAFSDHRPYILVAVIGSTVVQLLAVLGLPPTVSLLVALLVSTTIRIMAIYWDWSLPAWRQ